MRSLKKIQKIVIAVVLIVCVFFIQKNLKTVSSEQEVKKDTVSSAASKTVTVYDSKKRENVPLQNEEKNTESTDYEIYDPAEDEAIEKEHIEDAKEWANPEFIKAIKSGDIKSVENFIKSGINVNAKDYIENEYGTKYKYAPIIAAVEINNEKIVKMLLDAGANPNAKWFLYFVHPKRYKCCDTALSLAVKSGNANIVKMFIDAGVNINSKIDYYAYYNRGDEIKRDPPLIEAILAGNKEILKMLIDAGADLNIRGADYSYYPHQFEGGMPYNELFAVEFAAKFADDSIITMLIEASKDIKQKIELISKGILAAAEINNTTKVEMLLNMGKGLNLNKKSINSALFAAAGYGNEKNVEMLIKAGTDNFSDALIKAAESDKSENEKIIKMLIEAGADLNETKNGFNAYMTAVIYNHAKTAKILADNGASAEIDLDAIPKNNAEYILKAALLTAVKANSEEAVEKLLKAGVQPNIGHAYYGNFGFGNDIDAEAYLESYFHSSPLVLAVRNENEKIIKILIDAEADLNGRDSKSVTPLGAAISTGNDKIFQLLFDAGADPDIKSAFYYKKGEAWEWEESQEPLLDIAAKTGNEKIAEKFLKEKK
jgi:FOG: Ankyrin repeat